MKPEYNYTKDRERALRLAIMSACIGLAFGLFAWYTLFKPFTGGV